MIDRSIEVEAKLDSLRAIGVWLDETSRERGIPYEVAFGLDLAVHEAVENAVRHGSRGAGGRVRLHLRSDENQVEIVIEDDGAAFDPRTLPAPPVPHRIEDVVPGGQGVHLMRHFTDEIRYRREGDWNVLTLVRSLAPRREGA